MNLSLLLRITLLFAIIFKNCHGGYFSEYEENNKQCSQIIEQRIVNLEEPGTYQVEFNNLERAILGAPIIYFFDGRSLSRHKHSFFI